MLPNNKMCPWSVYKLLKSRLGLKKTQKTRSLLLLFASLFKNIAAERCSCDCDVTRGALFSRYLSQVDDNRKLFSSSSSLFLGKRRPIHFYLFFFRWLAQTKVFLPGQLVVNAAGFSRKPKPEHFQEAVNNGLNMFCFVSWKSKELFE